MRVALRNRWAQKRPVDEDGACGIDPMAGQGRADLVSLTERGATMARHKRTILYLATAAAIAAERDERG